MHKILRWTLLLLTAAAIAAAAVPSTAAQGLPSGRWTAVRTANFNIYGDADEKELQAAGTRLEGFRQVIRQLSPEIKLEGGVPTNVIVFRNAASYAPYKPRRADGSPDNAVAGYFLAGDNANFITFATGDRSEPFTTVFHEYLHFLLDANFKRAEIPAWFGEGLAEYYETLQIIDDRTVVAGTPPAGHVKRLRDEGLIPLDAFFAMDNAALLESDDGYRQLYYAQAWLTVHELITAQRDGGGAGLTALLAAARGAAAAHTAGRKELERKIRRYLDGTPGAVRIVLPQRIDAGSAASSSMSQAGAAALLGQLLYGAGRLDEGANLLRVSVASEPVTVSRAALGVVLARLGRFAEALEHLSAAAASPDAGHYVHFAHAFALSRMHMDDEGRVGFFPEEAARQMRSSLRRAIELDPSSAGPYRLLAFINYVNNVDVAEASRMLEKALEIEPGSEDITLLYAQVQLRLENYALARETAQRLERSATNSRVWSDAKAVIGAADQYFAALKAGARDDAEGGRAFGPLRPLILKRSTLSDEDVARYNRERENTNVNILLRKPAFGERQTVGSIERVTCSGEEIRYSVRLADGQFTLIGRDFAGLSLQVLTEGTSTFTFNCDTSMKGHLAVLTYRPAVRPGGSVRGRLTGVSFVPEFFKLRTPEEMANIRTVIIEDDRPFKERPVGRIPGGF